MQKIAFSNQKTTSESIQKIKITGDNFKKRVWCDQDQNIDCLFGKRGQIVKRVARPAA